MVIAVSRIQIGGDVLYRRLWTNKIEGKDTQYMIFYSNQVYGFDKGITAAAGIKDSSNSTDEMKII